MILIQDNFLDSVDEVRKIALSSHYNCDPCPDKFMGWKGYRTDSLLLKDNKFSEELQKITTKILTAVCEFYNLNQAEYMIHPYFHLYYEKTKDPLHDYENNKYHKDPVEYAAIVYLTPDPPPKTGTSILNGDTHEFINVENVYNRLTAYPGNLTHAPTNLFGDTKENGRMIITSFILKDPWAFWETTNGNKLKK